VERKGQGNFQIVNMVVFIRHKDGPERGLLYLLREGWREGSRKERGRNGEVLRCWD